MNFKNQKLIRMIFKTKLIIFERRIELKKRLFENYKQRIWDLWMRLSLLDIS